MTQTPVPAVDEIGTRTVLIVDDDPDIRDLVQLTLEDLGYRVLTAPNGAAALELIDQSPVHLILLDMRMPVMDGWSFTQAYRQLHGPCVPIVVVTAAQNAAQRSAEVAAEGHLAKPFGLADLRAVVEEYALVH
jgi:CheY-like chemotaxis protein